MFTVVILNPQGIQILSLPVQTHTGPSSSYVHYGWWKCEGRVCSKLS